MNKIYESDVEKRYCNLTKRAGGRAYKFTSPGRRSVPDRLIMFPVPEEHRVIVAQYIRFVEMKAPCAKPTELQSREIAGLRDLGYDVRIVDSLVNEI